MPLCCCWEGVLEVHERPDNIDNFIIPCETELTPLEGTSTSWMMVTLQQGPLKPFLRTPRCLGYNLSMRTWQIKADGGVFHNKQTGKLIQGLKWKGGFQREGVCGEIYHFIMDYSCLLEDARFHCCDAKVWFISKLCMRPWTVHKASDYEEKAVWGMTNWMLYHLEVTVISFFFIFGPFSVQKCSLLANQECRKTQILHLVLICMRLICM